MFGELLKDGPLTLADVPKAIIAHMHLTCEVDYSYDQGWVEACMAINKLPAYSLAAKALEQGLSPFIHCRPGGGLVTKK